MRTLAVTVLTLSTYFLILITNTGCLYPEVKSEEKLWERFHWNLTLHRGEDDQFWLFGIRNNAEDHNIQVEGATCTKDTSNLDDKYFEMHCKCDVGNSTFVRSNSVQCVRNYLVKDGCVLAPGSYQWSTGWSWDSIDDVFMVLDTNGSQIITTAFNVTAKDHQSCSVGAIAKLEHNTWVEIDRALFEKFKPILFKLNHFWHISWNIEEMDSEAKREIEGYVLRFIINCDQASIMDENLVSCLVFKVSGTLQFSSTFNDTTSNITTPVPTTITALPPSNITTLPPSTITTLPPSTITTQPSPSPTINKLIVIGIIAFAILVILAVMVWCFRKRKACFASKQRYKVHTPTSESVVIDRNQAQNNESFV